MYTNITSIKVFYYLTTLVKFIIILEIFFCIFKNNKYDRLLILEILIFLILFICILNLQIKINYFSFLDEFILPITITAFLLLFYNNKKICFNMVLIYIITSFLVYIIFIKNLNITYTIYNFYLFILILYPLIYYFTKIKANDNTYIILTFILASFIYYSLFHMNFNISYINSLPRIKNITTFSSDNVNKKINIYCPLDLNINTYGKFNTHFPSYKAPFVLSITL